MATMSNKQSLAAMYHTTGERMEVLRKERGYTQGDLANYLGVTKATISRYESNLIDIPRPKLQKLANYLGTTPAFLLCWNDQEDSTALELKGSTPAPKIDYSDIINEAAESVIKGQSVENRQETELLEIFRKLTVRGQTQLLSTAYEILDKESPLSFEKLTARWPLLTGEELTAFIKQITSEEALQQGRSEQDRKRVEELIQQAKERNKEREKK